MNPPEVKSMASISLRQAIGILVLLMGFLFIFSTIFSGFIMVLQFITGSKRYDGWAAVIGLGIGMGIMLFFSAGIIVFAIYLLMDKNGFDWRKFRFS